MLKFNRRTPLQNLEQVRKAMKDEKDPVKLEHLKKLELIHFQSLYYKDHHHPSNRGNDAIQNNKS